MRTNWMTTTLAILLFSGAGCDNKTATEQTPTASAAASGAVAAADTAAAHAPAGVEPGSHEDWCGGHQVPESMCTRCNAKLIPAFKATGDWCAEHSVPESQCLMCHPDLKIERPPKPKG